MAVATWASEATQTVGIYPRALHDRLRDGLALSGVRHIRELTTSLEGYVYGDGRYTLMLPVRRHGDGCAGWSAGRPTKAD